MSDYGKGQLYSIARTYLIKFRPFYASFIQDCAINLEWDKNPVDSSIVNGRIHLYVNEAFLIEQGTTPKELALLIEQQVNLLVNKHQIRSVNHELGRYVAAAHIATSQVCFSKEFPDYAQILTHDKAKEKFQNFPGQEKAAEIYYDAIPPDPPSDKDMQPYMQPEGGGDAGEGEGKAGDGEGEGPPGPKPIQHGAAWQETNTNEEQFDSILRDVVKDAAGKNPGNIPGHLKELIDKILRPPEVPWEEELKDFIESKVTTDTDPSWKRRNRNYAHAPYIMKGKQPSFRSRFVVFIDTSGSVSSDNLKLFLAEMVGIYNASRHTLITVCVDHSVQSVAEFDGDAKFEFAGRGGTQFDVTIKMCNGDLTELSDPIREKYLELLEADTDIDGAIYFTDGECGLSETTNLPLLWVITPDGTVPKNFPGKVVQMKDKKK